MEDEIRKSERVRHVEDDDMRRKGNFPDKSTLQIV